MKAFIFFTLLLTSALAFGQNRAPTSSPNASSSGPSTMEAISDGPIAPYEKEEVRRRAGSMGGAPNAGAGMGTGTGAGSSVGPETGRGETTAGSDLGRDEDDPAPSDEGNVK